MYDICPELDINVVPISDAFGPTQDDPTMELLVVSAETLRGGEKVNEGVFIMLITVLNLILFEF